MTARIAVYGAYGHTGRFVLDELRQRGLVPVACGRDPARLEQLAAATGVEVRTAAVDDAAALDAAFAGTAAVLHCAGPFLDTAAPVLDAALRARIHYLDVAAEQRAVLATFAHDAAARTAGVTVVPAMAFYGGFADLLASAVLDGATDADAVDSATTTRARTSSTAASAPCPIPHPCARRISRRRSDDWKPRCCRCPNPSWCRITSPAASCTRG